MKSNRVVKSTRIHVFGYMNHSSCVGVFVLVRGLRMGVAPTLTPAQDLGWGPRCGGLWTDPVDKSARVIHRGADEVGAGCVGVCCGHPT